MSGAGVCIDTAAKLSSTDRVSQSICCMVLVLQSSPVFHQEVEFLSTRQERLS